MLSKQFIILLLLTLLAYSEGVYIYSSFWAPLFDRRILNYRVDAAFDPDVAKNRREKYATDYGYRGQRLIAELGNGKDLGHQSKNLKMYEDVKFYNM